MAEIKRFFSSKYLNFKLPDAKDDGPSAFRDEEMSVFPTRMCGGFVGP